MDKEKPLKSCLSCKITSVLCLCSIGSYLILISGTRSTNNSKLFLKFLGTGSILLGIGEMFDKSPFRIKAKEEKRS